MGGLAFENECDRVYARLFIQQFACSFRATIKSRVSFVVIVNIPFAWEEWFNLQLISYGVIDRVFRLRKHSYIYIYILNYYVNTIINAINN